MQFELDPTSVNWACLQWINLTASSTPLRLYLKQNVGGGGGGGSDGGGGGDSGNGWGGSGGDSGNGWGGSGGDSGDAGAGSDDDGNGIGNGSARRAVVSVSVQYQRMREGEGTPLLKQGVVCVGANNDGGSGDETDWTGFGGRDEEE